MNICDELSSEVARAAARVLNEQGFFLDDDPWFISSVMEKCREEIEASVRAFGYCGGSIEGAGHFDDVAIYICYDSDRITHDDAMKILKGKMGPDVAHTR
ncbi:hypothetical protein [Desulfovibrio sp.]